MPRNSSFELSVWLARLPYRELQRDPIIRHEYTDGTMRTYGRVTFTDTRCGRAPKLPSSNA